MLRSDERGTFRLSPVFPMGHLVNAGYGTSALTTPANIALSRTYDPRGRLTNESDNGVTATYATGSFTVGSSTGGEQYNGTTYDSGEYVIVVAGAWGSCQADVSYGEGSTTTTVASGLASALNSSCSSVVSAVASGSTVTVTALSPNTPGSDYNLEANLAYYDGHDFSSPSFTVTPSGSTMTGGGAGTSTPVYSYQASYDNVGNVTSYTDHVMGTWNFGYDTLNRLTSTTAGANVPTGYANSYGCWSYDGFGNRTMEAYWTGSASPCANSGSGANLQLTETNQSTANNNQVAGYTYDDAGDVLNDNRNQYLYDADGRICAVAYNNGSGWSYDEYLYDAEGYRVGKVAESSLSCGVPENSPGHEYLLDLGAQQVTELIPSGSSMTPSHSNVFAGPVLATYDFPDSGVHFALTDPLGTRRVQISGAGVAEIGFVSLPYGNDLGDSDVPQTINYAGGSDATEQHFTHKEHDNETGNDYFEARYYSSPTGRFLSSDWSSDPTAVPYATYADPQSLNLFDYMRDNPLGGTDPTGHCPPCGEDLIRDYALSHPALANKVAGILQKVASGAADATEDAATGLADTVGDVAGVGLFLFTGGVQSTARGYQDITHPHPSVPKDSPVTQPQAAHRNKRRRSTTNDHQKGVSRKQRDQGGEKADWGQGGPRRPPSKRPLDPNGKPVKGPWPPKTPKPTPDKKG